MLLLVSVCMKNFELGYVIDFVSVVMCVVFKDVLVQNICIIVNVGGVNLCGCVVVLQVLVDELGVSVCIVVVEGDDVMLLLFVLCDEGVCELQSGCFLFDKVVSVNVYFGVLLIKVVFDVGVQVVIMG